MHFPNGVGDVRRSDCPANSPSRHAVRFGEAINRDGAVLHAVEARNGDVLSAVVDDVLVNLVSDGQHVEFDAQIANEFQFFACEHLPRRIVWGV